MLSRDLQRLEHILDYCEDIQNRLAQPDCSREAFMADREFQYAMAFCILQIGELAGKLSEELRMSSDDKIPWAKIRGMRNIVVHDYGSIDLDILWSVINSDIPGLKAFCEQMLDGDQ